MDDPSVRRTLTQLLRHEDASVRHAALAGLKTPGARASAADFLEVLRSADPGLRCAATYALAEIGEGGPEAIGPLREALGAKEPFLRKAAALALGEMGPAARQAKPDLERTGRDRYPSVRAAAEKALRQLNAN
jgi:HEAT repeat protein